MGISRQGVILWKSYAIQFATVIYLLEQHHRRRRQQGLTDRLRPRISLDISLLGYIFLNNPSLRADKAVILIAKCFAERGIDVLLDADGMCRHHSKRAHQDRVAHKDRLRLQLLEHRAALAQFFNDPNPNKESIAQKEDLANTIRSKEKQQHRGLPDDFLENIEDFAKEWGASEGTNVASITFATALWQADPAIAKRAIDGEIEAIVSGDSDFAMYVGIGGRDSFGDIMLRNPKLTKKKDSIETFEIWTGQRGVTHYIDEILEPKLPNNQSTIFPNQPDHPVFDGVRSLRVRTLFAVAIGCDALPGGIVGFSAAKLNEKIKAEIDWKWDDTTVTEFVLNKLVTASKTSKPKTCKNVAKGLTKEVFKCLSDSLMYEQTSSGSGYLTSEPPTKLDDYNTLFGNGDEEWVDGPKVVQCRGCLLPSSDHLFLEAEGSYKCHICCNRICRSCIWDQSALVGNTEAHICLPCKYDSFVGGIDEVTEVDMRKFLYENNVSYNATATYEEIVQLYHLHKDSNDDNVFSEAINEVQFPLLPSSALYKSELFAHDSPIRPTIDDYTKKGSIAGIIRDLAVGPKKIVDLVCLLASLTRYKKQEKGEALSVEHVVPANVIKMGAESRVHSGGRIVKRSLRHSLDPRTPSISDANFIFGYYKDEACLIVLDHKVKASMKKDLYPVECAFTENALVATTCGCKAGCRNKGPQDLGRQRVACTHCFTTPVQAALELHQWMAEDLLYELRLRFVVDDDAFMELDLPGDKCAEFRAALERLIFVAKGNVVSLDPCKSFVQWLSDFRVGTDCAKKPTGEPKVESVGLLRHKCKYESPLALAKKLIEKSEPAVEDAQSGGDNIDDLLGDTLGSPPNYLGIKMCMEALNGIDVLSSVASKEPATFTPIGFELCDYRACKLPVHERSGPQYTHKLGQIRKSLEAALIHADSEHSRGYCGISKVPAAATAFFTESSVDNQENVSPNRSKRKTAATATPSPPKRRRKIGTPPIPRSPPPNAECRPCCANKCGKHEWLPFNVKCVGDKPTLDGKTAAEIEKLEQPGGKLDQWYCKCFERNETLERLGRGRSQKLSKRFRYCRHHAHELVKNKTTTRKLSDGSIRTLKIPDFYAPVGTGCKGFLSPTKTANKGIGRDRQLHRLVTEIKETSEFGTALQQTLEMEDVRFGKHRLSDINEQVVEAAGLAVHHGADEHLAPPPSDSSVDAVRKREQESRTCIRLKDLKPSEVKRRTGHRDLIMLLSTAMVACDGNLKQLYRTTSKMTWLEEWVFYYEFKYGRTKSRWIDYENEYDCTKKPLRRILLHKLRLEKAARDRWPMYATYEEDATFRGKQWDQHFDRQNGPRIIMHDATGISMQTSTDAELQRALFSDYYAGPCAKAGVSNQLCGWIRGMPLCTGRITDSQMIKETGILEEQKIFTEKDAAHSNIPFTNTYDKGFRNTHEAAAQGQKTMQPDYSKGNFQFTGRETLHTACVAVVRSGNERAVNRCKMSWFVKRGCAYQLWDIDLLCDIWEAWTFQVNFMYDKYL